MTKIYYDSLAQEFKSKAMVLIDDLASLDTLKVDQAERYFNRFDKYAGLTAKEILNNNNLKIKDVLNLISQEANQNNFNELKKIIKNPFSNLKKGEPHQLWFNKYSEALTYLNNRGGYLFPYEKKYFLCKEDYIILIGLDPEDGDWKKISYNWVYPTNSLAHFRLFGKLLKAM
jgi:hypothetical protein